MIATALTTALLLGACRQYSVQQAESKEPSAAARHEALLLEANRSLVEHDRNTIIAFAHSRGWKMKTSPSGLWYDIEHSGHGKQAVGGQIASIAYTLSVLDSVPQLCYSSDSLGLKTFRIGQGNVETGLNEGLLMMRAGDRARLILPPHLAYGLIGDGDRIPGRAILLYEIKLLSLR